QAPRTKNQELRTRRNGLSKHTSAHFRGFNFPLHFPGQFLFISSNSLYFSYFTTGENWIAVNGRRGLPADAFCVWAVANSDNG
ncbi:MAG TPA: hypothetical protein PL157_20975, partial [Acidobacteriota bacterium]|nr:hypothetical protein [Acidobacteriota bacterium]